MRQLSTKKYPISNIKCIYTLAFKGLQGILFFFLFINSYKVCSAQESILEQKITLSNERSSTYELLNQITNITGYFFIYDSRILNSDKHCSVDSNNKTLKQILVEILDNPSLSFKVIEKHILIYKIEKQTLANKALKADSTYFITVKGQVFDKKSTTPISYATIGITENNIGTVSNYDGYFVLKIPSTFQNSSLVIAHLGYKSQQIPVKLLASQKVDIYLQTEYISIQEVIIRNIDPITLVKKAFQSRAENYSQQPVYITSFYREGVLKNKKYLNYSEAVLKVYKSSYTRGYESDQIKLSKSRKIVNIDQSDTLVLKIKSGLKSCLSLDIAKSIPDFTDPDYLDNYNYTKVDIVSINSRSAYAVAFEQKESIREPLYKGTIYIDTENFAIVSADFEVNPKYISDANNLFMVKRSRKFSVKPEKIFYSVNYNLWNGKYYINHIRGDLTIKFKKHYRILYNEFHAFLELASCQLDTLNVVKFNKDEVIKTNTIFLDSKYNDESFWGDYNIIAPEESINEALSRINSKIEELHDE